MSHYQPKGDRSEGQPRRIGRPGSGATYQRAAGPASTVKGGGAGGPGPSANAPPTIQASSSALQSSLAPTPASSNRSIKRSNGATGQPRGASSGGSEPNDNQKVQQSPSPQHQMQQQPHLQPGAQTARQAPASVPSSNGAISRSSRPGTPSSSSSAGSTEPVSPVAKTAGPGEASRSTMHPPFSFQFGSISPAFMHNTGVQIPPRTSSAPPNLDEQKREQARFEAGSATTGKMSMISSGQQQQQQQGQDVVHGRQPTKLVEQPAQTNRIPPGPGVGAQLQQSVAISAGGIPQPQFTQVQGHPSLQGQFPQANSHMQAQAAAVPSQAHLQIQAHLAAQVQAQQQGLVQLPISQQTLHSQQGLMQQSPGQGMQFPQSMAPPLHAGQMIGPQLTPLPSQLSSQQMPQMSHQLGPQMSGALTNQIPTGLPGAQYGPTTTNHYIQPRMNRAVKIVHPETHEELRFDAKSKKGDAFLDNGGPAMTTAAASLSGRAVGNGPPHTRPPLGYVSGAHHQMPMNFYPTLQTGSFSHTSQPYYPPVSTKSVVSSAVAGTPPMRYNFTHPSQGQGVPFLNPGPSVTPINSKVGSAVDLGPEPSGTSIGTAAMAEAANVVGLLAGPTQPSSNIPPTVTSGIGSTVVGTVTAHQGGSQHSQMNGKKTHSTMEAKREHIPLVSSTQETAATAAAAAVMFGNLESSDSAASSARDLPEERSNQMALPSVTGPLEDSVRAIITTTVPAIEGVTSKTANKTGGIGSAAAITLKPVVSAGQPKVQTSSLEAVVTSSEGQSHIEKQQKVESIEKQQKVESTEKQQRVDSMKIPRKNSKKQQRHLQQQQQQQLPHPLLPQETGPLPSLLGASPDVHEEKNTETILPAPAVLDAAQAATQNSPSVLSPAFSAASAAPSSSSMTLQNSQSVNRAPAKSTTPSKLEDCSKSMAKLPTEMVRKAGGKCSSAPAESLEFSQVDGGTTKSSQDSGTVSSRQGMKQALGKVVHTTQPLKGEAKDASSVGTSSEVTEELLLSKGGSAKVFSQTTDVNEVLAVPEGKLHSGDHVDPPKPEAIVEAMVTVLAGATEPALMGVSGENTEAGIIVRQNIGVNSEKRQSGIDAPSSSLDRESECSVGDGKLGSEASEGTIEIQASISWDDKLPPESTCSCVDNRSDLLEHGNEKLLQSQTLVSVDDIPYTDSKLTASGIIEGKSCEVGESGESGASCSSPVSCTIEVPRPANAIEVESSLGMSINDDSSASLKETSPGQAALSSHNSDGGSAVIDDLQRECFVDHSSASDEASEGTLKGFGRNSKDISADKVLPSGAENQLFHSAGNDVTMGSMKETVILNVELRIVDTEKTEGFGSIQVTPESNVPFPEKSQSEAASSSTDECLNVKNVEEKDSCSAASVSKEDAAGNTISEEQYTGKDNPGSSKATGSNPGHQIDSSVSVAPDVKQGSKKKKKKEILAKADAAGTTADLYNAYKAPEEKKQDEVKVAEVTDVRVSTSDAQKPLSTPTEKSAPRELDDWEEAAEIPSPKVTTGHPGPSVVDSAGPSESPDSGFVGDKKYTRDFMLTFKDQNRELPPDFEIRADIAELLLNPQAVTMQLAERDTLPSPGRMLDRQLSGGPRLERRGSIVGNSDEDRWTRQPALVPSPVRGEVHVEMGPAGGFRPGMGINQGLIARMPSNVRPGMPMPPLVMGLIPATPLMPSMMSVSQGLVRNNMVDADRWQRNSAVQKGLIPSPQTPLPAIHKAENRYEVGKASDEEEKKQRQIKAILNKLTPQNFDKLFDQVKDVNIESANTLTGVISQIFDKALTEPTFCETYAKFCVQLAVELPEFNEDGVKITFKRVLLNKCQEEFERGEREQAEADNLEEDGEVKLSPEEREQKRSKAKRRMLGNIRFIGELYKKSMLTERIMHECIIKLLGEYQNPEEEDVEALCKLMSTIGRMIDHPKAKEHIDAYFERMTKLSNNQKLPSRLRFMLKDVIDLRRNGWQERRKVEGPKKIEEVHRDAVQERQATVAQAGRLARGPSMGSSSGRRLAPQSEFGMRGPSSPMFSPSTPSLGSHRGSQSQIGMRGSYGQDVRMEDRLLLETRPMPMPLSQRSADEGPITLGPQGGLGRGITVRGQPLAPGRSALVDVPPMMLGETRRFGSGPSPGYNTGMGQDRGPYGGREEISQRAGVAERPLTPSERPLLERPIAPDRYGTGPSVRGLRGLERTLSDRHLSSSMAPSVPQQQVSSIRPSTAPALVPLSEEQLKRKCEMTLKEYYSSRDLKEAAQCVEDLKSPLFHPAMVSLWISISLEKKDLERELLVKLLEHLNKTEPLLLKHDQIVKGFEMALAQLEDTAMDVPRAPDYLAGMLGKLIAAGIISLAQVGKLLTEGGMEPGDLLQSADGLNMLGSILASLRKDIGEAALVEMYTSSGLRLEDFSSRVDRQMGRLDAILEEKNLQCLCPMMHVGKQLWEHLSKDEPTSETLRWLERDISSAVLADPAFLQILMTQILKYCVPPALNDYEKEEMKGIIGGRLRKYRPLLKRFASGMGKFAEAHQRQYIVAVQLFVNELGHPLGLMTALFATFYEEEVISESAYVKWEDDVKDSTPGRDKAIREVHKWLSWLKTAPEETEDDD